MQLSALIFERDSALRLHRSSTTAEMALRWRGDCSERSDLTCNCRNLTTLFETSLAHLELEPDSDEEPVQEKDSDESWLLLLGPFFFLRMRFLFFFPFPRRLPFPFPFPPCFGPLSPAGRGAAGLGACFLATVTPSLLSQQPILTFN